MVLIVDDGSPIVEQATLVSRIPLVNNGKCIVAAPLLQTQNRRKGAAILAGWQSQDARWRAFVDADGAIPAGEVRRVFEKVYRENQTEGAYFAVRVRGQSHAIKRSWFRHIASRAFAWSAGALSGERIRDSQCGFKIITNSSFSRIKTWLRGCGFCFDVELLVALRRNGIPVWEVPIDWQEQPGGKFHIHRHAPRMFLDLVRIRLRAIRDF